MLTNMYNTFLERFTTGKITEDTKILIDSIGVFPMHEVISNYEMTNNLITYDKNQEQY